MNVQILIPIAVAALVVIGLIVWLASFSLRSMRLKRKFGPEYDATLEKLGDRRATENELQEREKRVVKLDLHELNDHERERYHQEWTETQAEFVDDPTRAVERANRLVTEVMIARGFPVADFEQRTADLSVLYPSLVPKYRQANTIATKSRDGGTSTEELRQAMVDYHLLFDQILGTEHSQPAVKEQEKQIEAA